MKIVHVTLHDRLLLATDRAARKMQQHRSPLMGKALRRHLTSLQLLANEARDRIGYAKQPAKNDVSKIWEAEAAWSPM